jgi:hypothetical protein
MNKLALEQIFFLDFALPRGTQYRSWLRLYATSRKVAGLISEVIVLIFPAALGLGDDSALNRN